MAEDTASEEGIINAGEAAPVETAAPTAPPETRKEKERPRTAEDIFLEMESAEGVEKPKVIKAKGSKNGHA